MSHLRMLFIILLTAAAIHCKGQITVSADGRTICWKSRLNSGPYLHCMNINQLSKPGEPDMRSASVPVTEVCSNNGKQIIWKTDKGVFSSEIRSESIVFSNSLVTFKERAVYMDCNSAQTRILLKEQALRRGEKGCDPAYGALVVAKRNGDQTIYSGPLTSTKECSNISTAGFTASGFICYNNMHEYGINLLAEESNGSYQRIDLSIPANAEKGRCFWSSGSDRIFGVFRISENAADSLFGIYCYDFVNGKYSAPALIATEKSKWRPQISVSPDGNSVVWTSHPYFEILSLSENRKLKICRFEKSGWSEAETLIDFGEFKTDNDIQYALTYVSNTNIFLYQYASDIVYYYSSHDNKGIFSRFSLAELTGEEKISKTNSSIVLSVTDTISEGEYFPVRFPVKNNSDDTLIFDIYNVQHTPFSFYRIGPYGKNNVRVASVNGNYELNPIQRNNYSNLLEVKIPPHDSTLVQFWITAGRSHFAQQFQISRIRGQENIPLYITVRNGFVILRKDRRFYSPAYYPNGQMLELFSRESKDRIVYRSWYRNGNLKSCFVLNNELRRTKSSAVYHENGKLMTVCEKESRHYEVKRYYANGQAQELYHMKSNNMTGKWKRWDEQGQLISEARFRKFKIVTIATPLLGIDIHTATAAKYYREYYSNGKLKYEVHYSKAGRARGNWCSWYENGQMQTRQHYRRNKKTGNYFVYSSDGSLCYSGNSALCPDSCKAAKMTLPTLTYGTYYLHHDPFSPF